MFRTTAFDKLLDKATSHMLMEPDWPSTLQICDLIRQNDVTPRNALAALKKKLNSSNPHTAMFAVQLLESMVKNCGSSLHDELANAAYCETLHDLVKTTNHENVRQKMLELIQAWTYAFRKNPKYSELRDVMTKMKSEGYKFPAMRESDAMFTADSAPAWADGEVCHRCRVGFTLMQRKHHCRACGQVFCNQCSSKTSTLPKFGIEKEVRVCDACFDKVQRPSSALGAAGGAGGAPVMTNAAVTANATAAAAGSKDPELDEYLKSSLAQQNQAPPRKSDVEIREEEELQLAIALSQSEADAKEKEKLRATTAYRSFKPESTAPPPPPPPPPQQRPIGRSPSPDNPELARYLNRDYWENRTFSNEEYGVATSPSAPIHHSCFDLHQQHHQNPNLATAVIENGSVTSVADVELEEFVSTLKSQVEIFINRMKSNSSRGRSIANDSSVQTLFMNITAMHSRLLKYIQLHDDSRLYYERLQDKLTQVKDARAALDSLRDEHREKMRRQAEEAERQRQMLMAQKLEIMRTKKQEYLQYQRQLALQRIQEQEREMQMRQEQQKQLYMKHVHHVIHPMAHSEYQPPNGNYLPFVSMQPPPASMNAFAPPPMNMHAMPMNNQGAAGNLMGPMGNTPHLPGAPGTMGPVGVAPSQPAPMMQANRNMMQQHQQQQPPQPANGSPLKSEPSTAELISFD